MQTRTKSAFLLLAVLALGIVIGILAGGVMNNRRMNRLARMRTGPGIAQLVERAVQPESEEQRERIREIMDDAAPRFAEVFMSTREELRTLSDSVMSELEEVLSPDQMKELQRHMMMRRLGPPPEGRRGGQGSGRKPPRGLPPEGHPPPEGGPPSGAPPPPPE